MKEVGAERLCHHKSNNNNTTAILVEVIIRIMMASIRNGIDEHQQCYVSSHYSLESLCYENIAACWPGAIG